MRAVTARRLQACQRFTARCASARCAQCGSPDPIDTTSLEDAAAVMWCLTCGLRSVLAAPSTLSPFRDQSRRNGVVQRE